MTTDKRSIAELVDNCRQRGIKDVVFSPGSRNAPMVIAFVGSGEFNCYCIPDERVAAFYAMGLSLNSGKASIICCTSGSAALNYSGAISEAYYQGIPMLVLTADRPVEWIDQGIGQCIRQKDVYHNFIKASYQLIQEANTESELIENRSMVSNAILDTEKGFPGPVHVNVPLAEPLYGKAEVPRTLSLDPVDLSDETFVLQEEHKKEWLSSKRKLILFGLSKPDLEMQTLIQGMTEQDNIVLLTESCSNIQVQNSVMTIDRLITAFENNAGEYRPDLLITIGGPVVSKKIKSLFLNHKPKSHWHVSLDGAKDTFRSLSAHIRASSLEFINSIASLNSRNDNEFQDMWLAANERVRARHELLQKSIEWSDLKAFDILLSSLPEDSVLHMGNSTVVRYIQLFDPKKSVEYYGNRGVSGIDGCSSTAMGFASSSEKMNILITGDIAIHYDSNAFWHKHVPCNFRVIIINNSGGGIFRIIPGPSTTDQLTEYFEAYQERDASLLAKHFDVSYTQAHGPDNLIDVLSDFYSESDRPKILEIFTPREENEKILMNYFKDLHQE